MELRHKLSLSHEDWSAIYTALLIQRSHVSDLYDLDALRDLKLRELDKAIKAFENYESEVVTNDSTRKA